MISNIYLITTQQPHLTTLPTQSTPFKELTPGGSIRSRFWTLLHFLSFPWLVSSEALRPRWVKFMFLGRPLLKTSAHNVCLHIQHNQWVERFNSSKNQKFLQNDWNKGINFNSRRRNIFQNRYFERFHRVIININNVCHNCSKVIRRHYITVQINNCHLCQPHHLVLCHRIQLCSFAHCLLPVKIFRVQILKHKMQW